MTTKKLKSTINDAAVYFVNELSPAYDLCYDIMSEPMDKIADLKGLDDNSIKCIMEKFLKKRDDFYKRDKEAREILESKKEIYEKLKGEMDGWNLKELDNQIKYILKQQEKIRSF
jgi:hypothetical protein